MQGPFEVPTVPASNTDTPLLGSLHLNLLSLSIWLQLHTDPETYRRDHYLQLHHTALAHEHVNMGEQEAHNIVADLVPTIRPDIKQQSKEAKTSNKNIPKKSEKTKHANSRRSSDLVLC